MKKIKNVKQGFTLLELLVVVLIIGILASIALPQYQMAVTKAKVASILPIMRRWKDAMYEYKLQHGSYDDEEGNPPLGDTLGVSWPSDWENGNGDDSCGDSISCQNDYWSCRSNEDDTGSVWCLRNIDDNNQFKIFMFQHDESEFEDVGGMTTCYASGDEAHKVCKALGGKLIDGYDYMYKLN